MDETRGHPIRLVIGASALALIVGAIGAVLLGEGPDPTTRIIAVLDILLSSAWIPVLYLGASIGIGRVATLWSPDLPLRTRWTLELGAGFTLTLSLTHGLGILGLLNPLSAWIVVGIGLALLVLSLHERQDRIHEWTRTLTLNPIDLLFFVGAGAILALSCNPPGSLWDSEFGNYDSLSYHLELPRQWLELGRITPLDTNVYSYLPSYMESSTVHLAHLALAPHTDPSGLSGIVTDHGRIAISAQLLSALVTIGAAIVSGSLARTVLDHLGTNNATSTNASRLVRALVLWTPWMLVVGSLTYNESAVVLLIGCASCLALTPNVSVTQRAIWCALISAGACSCKPTALVLGVPIVGVALLSATKPKHWVRVVLLGSLLGALTLAPWLIRNTIASGNPIFPMGASIFGEGPWTSAQHARYTSAHTFAGSPLDRISALVLPMDGRFHIERFRGYTNLQWGILAALGFASTLLALIPTRTRRAALLTLVTLSITTLAWLSLTHLQSRFLIPTIPALGAGVALGFAALALRVPPKPAQTLALLMVLASITMSVWNTSTQRNSAPNALLPLGVGAFTGQLTSPDLEEAFWWSGVNATADDDSAILLLGDATPLYVRSPVIASTTYDSSLIAQIMTEHPGRPRAWIDELRANNIGWIVINTSELDRFRDSEWIDPILTQDRVNDLMRELWPPARHWTESRRALFHVERTE